MGWKLLSLVFFIAGIVCIPLWPYQPELDHLSHGILLLFGHTYISGQRLRQARKSGLATPRAGLNCSARTDHLRLPTTRPSSHPPGINPVSSS